MSPVPFSKGPVALGAVLAATLLAMLGLGAAIGTGSWLLAFASVGGWCVLLVLLAVVGTLVDKRRS